MIGEHVRCRLRDDATIATSRRARCIVAAVVLARGERFGLVSFGLADTHLHIIRLGRVAAGYELARRVEISLTRLLHPEVGFARVRVKPINDQWHLYRAFDYALKQDARHRLGIDLLREATNLPDLLRMRITGSYTRATVRAALPRVTRGQLLEALGVDRLEPADEPIDLVCDAAAAAICQPELRGSSRLVRAARRAVIDVVGPRRSTRQIAGLLRVDRTTVTRLVNEPANPDLVVAVRLQLGLRRVRVGQLIGR